ncbi:MAG: FHA domain-containing protein [Polyangiaceae bacterium]|nr:FHA domain-containing protein [Polyangiaceae bacterium]
MIRIHQTFGAHAGRRFELTHDRIRFGRLPESEVAFDPHADLDASGRHAEIVRESGRYVLIDVGSRNGTFIRGKRIDRYPLRGGEEIEFGPGGPRVRVELSAPGEGADRAGPVEEASELPLDSEPDFLRSSIETTRVERIADPSADRLLRVAIAVLVFGIAISVVALAVFLRTRL